MFTKTDVETSDRTASWWVRQVVEWCVIVLAIYGLVVLTDKAWGAEKLKTPSTSSRCVNDPDVPCSGEYSKKRVRQFNKGKLGTSVGARFPKSVIKRINKKMAARTISRADGDWWKYPFENTMCLIWESQYKSSGCVDRNEQSRQVIAAGDTMWTLTKEAGKITVVCGGTAIILGTKGGPVAAGTGASACLWVQFWLRIF